MTDRVARAGIAAVVAALVVGPTAGADLADETALAEKHAPVVRLVEQARGVRARRAVPADRRRPALRRADRGTARAPGTPSTSSRSARAAEDLAGLFEYHLDFPGHALEPGCDYERWDRRLREGSEPTVYAHVATDPGHPGKLALQYWLFYTYNDWNNLHEGDWEMIQLVFEAAAAEEALDEEPVVRRLQPARGRRVAPSGTRRSSSSSTGAVRSSTRPPARTRTSSTRPCSSAAPPSRAWGATTRAGRTSSSSRRSSRSRATRPRRARRSRGSRSRAAGASCRTRSSTGRPGPI